MMAIEKDMDQRAGPSIPLCDSYLHIKYGSNPLWICLSYRENDEELEDAE